MSDFLARHLLKSTDCHGHYEQGAQGNSGNRIGIHIYVERERE